MALVASAIAFFPGMLLRRDCHILIIIFMANGTTSEFNQTSSVSSSRSPDSWPCLARCVRPRWSWIVTFHHHTLRHRPCPRNPIFTQHRKCPPAVLLVVGKHDTLLLPVSSGGLYPCAGR